jgi:TPR repeat protein
MKEACVILFASGIALCTAPAAQAFTPPPWPKMWADGVLLHKAADSGINIVRMPPRPLIGGQPSTIPAVQQPPTNPPRANEPTQPQGRLLKLTARAGSQSNEPRKGWLGVSIEALELPLALSLGLPNGDGVLLLGTTAGGPADQARLRFGDVVVGMNGRSIAGWNELRERIMSLSPGSDAIVEVWRVAADDGDFLQTLRSLADGGNAHVMYRLGRLYAAGNGVTRDDALAVQWYRKGADAGNTSAATALAVALLEGRGAAINQQEGLRLLKAAAANSHPEAMYRLAYILVEGKIAEKDALEAARLFTKAAEAGHASSMVEIGRMYYNGSGVQADLSKAAMWYRRAADLGNSAGMVNLGWLHENGKGVEIDVAKAVTLYRRAVDLNNPSAMVNLALLLAQGKGVDKNEVAAVALYRRSADLGNASAMNNLAWMLQGGNGVERKDPEGAAELMLKALDKRNEYSYRQMTQNSRAWSQEFRQALQRKLRDAGVYSGRIDAELGDTTIAAINAYINRNR